MLCEETVDTKTLELIKNLCKDPVLKDFHLVGGTALSLQVGHRISVDIDLFSSKPCDAKFISGHLQSQYGAEIDRHLTIGIWCYINDIKTDMMSHQYPWLEEPKNIDGVRMVSLPDIAAMKINVIHGKGTREKDFADIFKLLEHLSLNSILEAYAEKYADVNLNMARYSLLYQKDIKKDSIQYIGTPISKREITTRIKDAVLNPNKVFNLSQDILLKKNPHKGKSGPAL